MVDDDNLTIQQAQEKDNSGDDDHWRLKSGSKSRGTY